MAQDETEFDKLLRETREWEARDRQRHKSLGMQDNPASEAPRAPPPRAPMVTVDEITARSAKPTSAQKITTLAAPAIRAALKAAAAAKASEGERPAKRAKGGPWGWIWAILILFFLIRHFFR